MRFSSSAYRAIQSRILGATWCKFRGTEIQSRIARDTCGRASRHGGIRSVAISRSSARQYPVARFIADLVAVSGRSNRRAATAMTIPSPITSSKLLRVVTDRIWIVTPCPKSRCRAHLTPMNPLPSSMGEFCERYRTILETNRPRLMFQLNRLNLLND